MAQSGERAPWGLVGRSEVMGRLRAAIRAFGPEKASIHLQGETGTGKELVARAIHQVSGRPGRFAAINAAGLSDDLFEAELFGHARGAFTGAATSREGHVAGAHRGTLFLDEVAELSRRGQAKLLRFLDSGEYYVLGESRVRHTDVRVLSAANANLGERVEEGRFREDLLYRLLGEHILLPPLRQRGRDVLQLARHFLLQACGERRRPPVLSREAEDAMARYRWPGNVRQLAAEADRLVVKAAAGVVRVEHLSPELRESAVGARGDWRSDRDEFERHLFGRALERNGGNRTATAAALGISRQALGKKIRRLGIRVPPPALAPR